MGDVVRGSGRLVLLALLLFWLGACPAHVNAQDAPPAAPAEAAAAAQATPSQPSEAPAAAPTLAAPATAAPAPAVPAAAPTAARLLPTATPRSIEPAEPFDWTGALLDLAWKLGLVVLLAYGALALLRRTSLAPMLGQARGQLQVLESVSLGQNRSAALLRVGERRVLVGVTPTQVTTLAQWEEPTGAAPAANGSGPEVPSPSFQAALQSFHSAPVDPARPPTS